MNFENVALEPKINGLKDLEKIQADVDLPTVAIKNEPTTVLNQVASPFASNLIAPTPIIT